MAREPHELGEGIREVLLLHAQPGDAVVLKLNRQVGDAELADIRDRWEAVFRGTPMARTRLVILQGGNDLYVVRGDDEATP